MTFIELTRAVEDSVGEVFQDDVYLPTPKDGTFAGELVAVIGAMAEEADRELRERPVINP